MTTSKPYPLRELLQRGLSRKLFVILVIGAAIITTCTIAFGFLHAESLRTDAAGDSMQQGAEMLAGQIDISLGAAVGLLKQLASDAHIQEAAARESLNYAGLSEDEISRLVLNKIEMWKASDNPQGQLDALRSTWPGIALADFAGNNTGFSDLIAVDSEGQAVATLNAVDKLYPGRDKKWTQSNITGLKKAAVSEPFYEGKSAAPSVLICVPILSEASDTLAGELYAKFSLQHIVPSDAAGEQEIVGFLLLASADKRQLYLLNPPDMASPLPAPFRAGREKPSAGESGRFSIELEQHDLNAVAGFAPVKSLGYPSPFDYRGKPWFVVQAIPQSHVMGPINALFVRTLAFALGLLALVSIAGLAVTRRILRPIHMLKHGVQEIGQGNLEHRIDVRSGDEIEVLAFEFNRMAERMQRTQEQLQRRGQELEQRVNQLRRLQAQLMQSERMAATGELAAQIAHEINNPLGIIKNYVGIAKMLMPEEDANRENLRIVDQEINRIAGIVRRLLKFAKPGSEDIQNVQINQILEELLALLRGQLFRRKIEVAVDLHENLPEVSISTDQMRQVFLNLIKNAEDAMADGGKLGVRTRYRKGMVEVEISDTGCGIPNEDVKNIFEPFFTTKGVKGTGLGLSVSYGIVKNYSGEINVESEPGRGTTFTIQLPVVSDKVFQVIQSP
jgi:two-component system NtrC family sensor kinase